MTDHNLILVAQIAGGFGVKGEVRVTAWTADPMALLDYGPLLRADGTVGLTLTSGRPEKTAIVGRAKEIATKEQADALRGLKLFVPRDRLPPPDDEDEFYLTDLIGLAARDADDAVIGTVKSVPNFGAGDMLEIAPVEGGPTWYLPFTREAVPEVRLADRWLRAIRPAEVDERDEA
ncbi:MAG: ribosome maturation factor RimM [Alphaproteobacteria bacterium]|nr:ribosome maturation factor RimM [Alphaproteobacteria bacterium]MBU1526785.1 ribosome maturation factor RimM [Alphaproteobacteria bacterium]MBU2118463.1 ribosome maturation factor RimM [Alphaproteobacteria bacterium]MBU2351859.1 ribosome maturation factor RimM [Alphaproteobacteria bacterium]MBU2382639.1 ribosome maturation factor RimM [Alphaproteobacteria bacterium]